MRPAHLEPDLTSQLPIQPRDRLRIGRRISAAQMIYDDMWERIMSLELEPNTVLSRPVMAEAYGVSQTPTREAIIRLEQAGLVESFPQSRTIVSRIDIDNAVETHFLRTAVEIEIVRNIARNRDSDLLAPIEAIHENLCAIGLDLGRQAEFSILDRQFHEALFIACGQTRLFELVRERSCHLDRLRRIHLPQSGKMARIVRQHGEVLDAIRTGDEDLAAEKMRTHLSGTIENIAALVETHPDFFADTGAAMPAISMAAKR